MVWEIHLNLKDQLFPLERRKADELWDKHYPAYPGKKQNQQHHRNRDHQHAYELVRGLGKAL